MYVGVGTMKVSERLKAKTGRSMCLTYTGFEGNETDPIMIFQFITTDKAKASRGGEKVSVF